MHIGALLQMAREETSNSESRRGSKLPLCKGPGDLKQCTDAAASECSGGFARDLSQGLQQVLQEQSYVCTCEYICVCVHTHTHTRETKCETNTVIAEKYHPIPVRTHLTLRENKEEILSK